MLWSWWAEHIFQLFLEAYRSHCGYQGGSGLSCRKVTDREGKTFWHRSALCEINFILIWIHCARSWGEAWWHSSHIKRAMKFNRCFSAPSLPSFFYTIHHRPTPVFHSPLTVICASNKSQISNKFHPTGHYIRCTNLMGATTLVYSWKTTERETDHWCLWMANYGRVQTHF